MTTTKKIKGIIEEFINDRKDWEGEGKINNFYLSICLLLIDYRFVTVNDCDDLSILYDNLVINNEIITEDNYKEYSEEFLVERLGRPMSYIEKDLKDHSYLLNYYKNAYDVVNCCIRLYNNYNAIDWR